MLFHLDDEGDEQRQVKIEVELIGVATQFSDHILLSENEQRPHSSGFRATRGYQRLK